MSKNFINVRVEVTIPEYVRYQIAYYNDVIIEDKNWEPRLAKPAECRVWIKNNISWFELGDDCPDFAEDGTISG